MKSFRIAFAFAAALLAAPAIAQDAGPQKPMQPSEEKLFKDWTVRCFPVPSPSPCEMIEVRVAKKTGQRILGVLLAYVPARNAHILQISVPLGISIQNGLVINADTYKSPVLKYRRCDQMGCYVEAAVGDDVIGQLSKATKAETQIVTVDGRKFNLVFSLDGFNEAHNTLVELTKAKAKAPAAAPAAQ
ncbi:invasion protein IalB [Rhizomicrobium palustre]|uniref:Invasion protein IalB n=1 Tax=Rhizomicrobium palustre TaxID=189966 RepID=A0A846MZF5_9PROT|nr:invasion associated locus B family protein [Rhizomicrobium palustre]NIK88481.1 invasion protein IalB [Rhizomicrobium palustre]